MIPAAAVQQITDTARIEEVVGDYVTLKRRGSNMIGLCPFHNERTPSFSVSPAKGIYKCFGCGKAGNAVNFLMEHDSLTYPEALRNLATRYNIQIEETQKDAEVIASEQLAQSIFVINNYALEYYKAQLFGTEEGKSLGLSYFKERGLTEDTIHKFGLGYAANEFERFYQHAVNAGYQPDLLVKAALVLENERGKRYDFLRGRIVFPIYNLSGKVVAFAGRLMTNEKTAAKYVNSAETDVYHKSKVLYGLHQARNGVKKQDECLLVEGYMDVITMHQAGFDYAVASSGTSLTIEQVRLIKRFTQNITFLYDGDDAGLKAALRGLDIALTEGLNVRVCVIPDGDDPDSYLRKHGAQAMRDLLSDDEKNKNKQSFLHFQADQLLKAAGNDPVKRADVVNKIVESLSLVNDPVRRSMLTQGLSQRMNVSEEILVRQINKVKRTALSKEVGMTKQEAERLQEAVAPNPESHQEVSGASDMHVRLERSIARLFIEHGAKAYGETTVASYLHQEVSGIDWVDAASEFVYKEFAKSLETGELPTHHQLLASGNQTVVELVTDVVDEKYTLSPNWAEMHDIYTASADTLFVKDVDNVMNRFKLFWIEKLIVENNVELKEAEAAKNDRKLIECLQTRILLDKQKKEIAGISGTAILALRNAVR